jgi:uncharacterized protein YceH (UPF0502 family)
VKYRHLAEEALSLGREELALLAVLLLRGPQTPGELKARSERMAAFASLEDVERVLATLCERGYARRVPRRPGQKEDRFEHLLGGEKEESETRPESSEAEPERTSASESDTAPPSAGGTAPGSAADTAPPSAGDADLADRVSALEGQIEELRRELAALREQLPA